MVSIPLNATRPKEVTNVTKKTGGVSKCTDQIIVYIDEKLMKSRPFPMLRLEISLRISS